MKKWIALFLALAMLFSLCACGGKETPGGEDGTAAEEPAMTKDEMLETAVTVDMNTLNGTSTNEAKALSYVGRILKVTGYISEVTAEYCVLTEGCIPPFDEEMCANRYAPSGIHAYLPLDILADLTINDEITVVGEVEAISQETFHDMMSGDIEQMVFEMKTAYIVE